MSNSVSTTAAERDRERDRFIWLFNNCQDRVGLYDVPVDADSKPLWREDPPEHTGTRPLQSGDVNVTVKWSKNPRNNELLHIKTIEDRPHFTLGIRFENWRRYSPESKLVSLSTMVGHTRYSHKDSVYWKFMLDIWTEMLDQFDTLDTLADADDIGESRPALLDDPIDLEYLKNRMLDSIYDGAPEEGTRDKMLVRAEELLNYQYEWVGALDYPRKYKGNPAVRPDPNGWANTATRIDPHEIEFSTRYSDEELVNQLESLDSIYEHANVVDMPKITGTDDNGTIYITENEPYAALIARTTTRDGDVPVELA